MRTQNLSRVIALSLLASACADDPSTTDAGADLPEGAPQVAVGVKTGWIPGPDGPLEVTYEVMPDGRKVMDGDILLTQVSDTKPDPRLRSAFHKTKDWAGGAVPYEIDGAIPAAQQQQIKDAIAEWNANSPFWVLSRNASLHPDYIRFVPSDRCESPIGRQGGRQDIQVGPGCDTAVNIHEIGHALGFFHEQARQDRDNHINIDFGNVKDGKKHNFNKFSTADGMDFGPYDITSIMHYPSMITDTAFVKDTTKATITRKDGTGYTVSNVLTPLDRAGAWRKALVSDILKTRWEQNQWIGFPLDSPRRTADNLGRFVPAQGGRIYVHLVAPTQSFLVYGDIYGRYLEHGADGGFLGVPLTDELGTPDGVGRYNHFQGGSIYWHPNIGARLIYGLIRDKWASIGWETSFLGYPVTDEMGTPDGRGRYNHFQGGSIYWTPETGAQLIYGAIRDKWAALGWETHYIGYPVTDELGTPDGIGRYNHFERGSIYWSPNSGAYAIWGSIRDRWAQLGWETSFLGYPVTDELVTPDGVGRFNHFQGGSIYWTPSTGAVEVSGAIRDKWASLGWETSCLGYPTAPPHNRFTVDGRYLGTDQSFQGGSVSYSDSSISTTHHCNAPSIIIKPPVKICILLGTC